MMSIFAIYQRLFSHYGHQHWWPAKSHYEMLIGAILTQNTNWRNVDKALINLGERLEPAIIAAMPLDELIELIKPAGFYNQKARYIQEFTQWFAKYHYDVDEVSLVPLEPLRKALLHLKGIGRETADCMLVYAFDKPSFVIDAYTRRVFTRIGFIVPKNYDDFRRMIEDAIPRDVLIYNEFHALIVEHAKIHCQAKPICLNCPLFEVCDSRQMP